MSSVFCALLASGGTRATADGAEPLALSERTGPADLADATKRSGVTVFSNDMLSSGSDGFGITLIVAATGFRSSSCEHARFHGVPTFIRGVYLNDKPISACSSQPSKPPTLHVWRGHARGAGGCHYLDLSASGRASELHGTEWRGRWSPTCAVLGPYNVLEQSVGSSGGQRAGVFRAADSTHAAASPGFQTARAHGPRVRTSRTGATLFRARFAF